MRPRPGRAAPPMGFSAAGLLAATGLLVEYQPPSTGASTSVVGREPRFSWQTPLMAGSRGLSSQAAFQISLRCDTEAYDSGRVESNSSTNVELGAPPTLFQPDSTCIWNVRWWTSDGSAAETSKSASFDIGLLDIGDWGGAEWIGSGLARQLRLDLPPIGANRTVCRGRIHYVAPGGATLSLDGEPVGEQNGIGAFTNPHKRMLSRTLNVTALLNKKGRGEHTLGVLLGHGMYGNYHLTAEPGEPTIKLKVSLRLCAAEPTATTMAPRLVVVTSHGGTASQAWRCSTASPILSVVSAPQFMKGGTGAGAWNRSWLERFSDDPFRGTIVDHRLAQPGWDTPAFANLTAWGACPRSVNPPRGVVRPLMLPETRTTAVIQPVGVVDLPSEFGGPVRVFDFGVNIVGVTRLRAHGSAGAEVVVRHAETRMPNGSILLNWTCGHGPCGCGCCAGDPTCVGVKAEFQRDRHYLRGSLGGETVTEELVPRFTWHGFRYAAVELKHGAQLESIEALVLQTPALPTGSISFGGGGGDSVLLTNFHAIAQRSRQGNLAQYVPTDCPTREKHYWLDDAEVTGPWVFAFLMAPSYTLMLDLIQDDQWSSGLVPEVVPVDWSHTFPHLTRDDPTSPRVVDSIVCSSAYPILTACMLRHYHDIRLVRAHFPSLQLYMRVLLQRSGTLLPDFEVDCGGSSNESASGYQTATGPALAAFKYIQAVDAMVELAAAVNDTTAQAYYSQLGNTTRGLWHGRYWNATERVYGYDSENGWAVQALSSAALTLGQLPPGRAALVVQRLREDMARHDHHFTVGEVGVGPLLSTLSSQAVGMHDDAMRLMTQTSLPSFGFWLAQNATTCWESWSAGPTKDHPGQPSHNHVMLCGAADNWLYTHVAGVTAARDGWTKVQIAPKLTSSRSASATNLQQQQQHHHQQQQEGYLGPSSVAASVSTMSGVVSVAWDRSFTTTMTTTTTTTTTTRRTTRRTTSRGNTTSTSPLFRLKTSLPVPASVHIPLSSFGPIDVKAVTVAESGKLIWSQGEFHPGAVRGVLSGEQVCSGAGQKECVIVFECSPGDDFVFEMAINT